MRQPRQRQTHHRRVDLVLDLRGDVGFNRALVDAVGEAPVQHLRFGEVFVRREATTRRREAARTVAGAAVGFSGRLNGAVATPVGGDYDIGVGAFNRLGEKAFDEPEDGHKLGGRGCGEQVINRSVDLDSNLVCNSRVCDCRVGDTRTLGENRWNGVIC
jgi:hypothetical protein